jgi:hypothetical protein
MAQGAVCPMTGRTVIHEGIEAVLVVPDHGANGWKTRMNNIFWIIGVIVVVLAVLSFLGLR